MESTKVFGNAERLNDRLEVPFEFETLLWKSKVENIYPRISKNVNICKAKIYSEIIKSEVNFHWNRVNNEPLRFGFHTPNIEKENKLWCEH